MRKSRSEGMSVRPLVLLKYSANVHSCTFAKYLSRFSMSNVQNRRLQGSCSSVANVLKSPAPGEIGLPGKPVPGIAVVVNSILHGSFSS